MLRTPPANDEPEEKLAQELSENLSQGISELKQRVKAKQVSSPEEREDPTAAANGGNAFVSGFDPNANVPVVSNSGLMLLAQGIGSH